MSKTDLFREIPYLRSVSVGLIMAVGGALSIVNTLHLLEEESVFELLFLSVATLISLSLIGLGIYVWNQEYSRQRTAVLTFWFMAGTVLMTVFGALLLSYLLGEGVTLPYNSYILALFPSYGSVPALITGWYDGQRRIREARLQESQDMMVQVEEIAEVGGWEFDPETWEVAFTDGASTIRGIKTNHMPFDEILETYHEKDRAKVERAVKHCAEDGISFDIEGQIRTTEGHARWIRVRGERVTVDGKPVVRGAIQNVTPAKQREQRIMVLNRVLRHNIRNDLTVIVGNAELLQEKVNELHDLIDSELTESVPEKATEELRTVSTDLSTDLKELGTLLDEIDEMDVRTIEEGAETIRKTSDGLLSLAEKSRRFEDAIGSEMVTGLVDIRPIVTAVVEEYRAQFPQLSFELSLDNVTTFGNGKAIRIIIEECIENAVVHNTAPNPNVSVSATERGEEWVELEIQDNGPGIPESEQTVFANGREDALHHSSGIGLWTVKWLTTHLDGTTTIESTDDGTTVSIRFPKSEGVTEGVFPADGEGS